MDFTSVPKLDDIDVDGKCVLMRVDFNVPLQNNKVADDTRIRAALPSINYVLENGGRIVLMSHLGRPKGKPNPAFSLEPVGVRLAELLESGEVILTDSCVGDGAKRVVRDLRDGQVALLENLRFYKGETENDDKFSRELAADMDVYVNDAFGVVHRSHASVAGITKYIRVKAAGLLLEKEMRSLTSLLGEVKHPYVAILGGAKVSDKIGIIENLINRVDTLVIGGAMANTFVASKGGRLGKSLVESDKLALARDLLGRARSQGVKLLIPTDFIVADGPNASESKTVPAGEVPDGQMALDIGPETRKQFADVVGLAGTILWNGPMGMFEKDLFAAGTMSLAKAISGAAGFSVVGGGDTVAAVHKAGLEAGFDHVSTGGGASLNLIEGKTLPGIAALAP
jgi:phosphoglycerate kinase